MARNWARAGRCPGSGPPPWRRCRAISRAPLFHRFEQVQPAGRGPVARNTGGQNMDFRRSTSLLLFCCTLFALTTLAPLAFAANCLQDEFAAAGFHQKLNCTANDVRIAEAVNPRAPDGTPITTCFAGTTFSFIADFQVVTTATSRENIGLYMATGGQSSALTGQCVDNIMSPLQLAVDSQTSAAGGPHCLGCALLLE